MTSIDRVTVRIQFRLCLTINKGTKFKGQGVKETRRTSTVFSITSDLRVVTKKIFFEIVN